MVKTFLLSPIEMNGLLLLHTVIINEQPIRSVREKDNNNDRGNT